MATNGAEFVIAIVRDDEASRELWLSPEAGALAGMGPKAVAIESATLSKLGSHAGRRGLPTRPCVP
jgi:3-hydroxyisobutyrate dehydrogenase